MWLHLKIINLHAQTLLQAGLMIIEIELLPTARAKFSYQDETWAKFSTLGVSMFMHAMQLHS